MSRLPLPLLLILVLGLSLGCTQRETDIGADAILGQPQESFVLDSVAATVGENFAPEYTNGASASLVVGNAKQMFAFFGIRFDATVALDSFVVDSMRIRFQINHVWPRRGEGTLEVRVREIPQRWTEVNFVPDSVTARETWPIVDSVIVPTTDTSYVYQVPDTLWSRWIAGDTTTWGLLFEPRNEGVVVEFRSGEDVPLGLPDYPPQLTIRGRYWSSTAGSFRDTTLTRGPNHDAYIGLSQAPADTTRLYLSQGAAGRAAVYFPMDSVMREYSRTVARAELQLFADSLHPGLLRYPDFNIGLRPGNLTSKAWVSETDTVDWKTMLGPEFLNARGAWDATNTVFTMDVTPFVAAWIARPETNNGLQIVTQNEQGLLAREVFHSPQSPEIDKRPRIHLWFIESSY